MKLFLTPIQYNKIYSESSGILITNKIDEEISYLSDELNKEKEKSQRLLDTLRYIHDSQCANCNLEEALEACRIAMEQYNNESLLCLKKN